ncbi:hypothetical protein [Sphingopyxis yananensis]|nr:hypothetical protein [Sphingopyxis yananensis]MCC2603460.1 hypothetical protein [Sphingopyxis yananensis]
MATRRTGTQWGRTGRIDIDYSGLLPWGGSGKALENMPLTRAADWSAGTI